MRIWLTIALVLLSGCAGSSTEDGADTDATPAAPEETIDRLDLHGCIVGAGVFAMPTEFAAGFLPAGFKLAPHPLGLPAAAMASVGIRCQSVNGTAINDTIEMSAEAFGFLWVEPPAELAGADLHLLPLGGFIPHPQLLKVYARYGFADYEAADVKIVPFVQGPAHTMTIEAGPAEFRLATRIEGGLREGQPEQTHRVFAVRDAAVRGYVDVALGAVPSWQGPATLNMLSPTPSPQFAAFQQPGMGLYWDLSEAAASYTFTDLRAGNGTA